jgi:lysophospholipase L1-like esterase
MSRKRSRSRAGFSWKSEYGGMPTWAIAASAAVILAIVGVVAVAPSLRGDAEPYVRPSGAFATPTPTAALTLSESPTVLMLGDSYMLGTGSNDRATSAWAPQVATALGWNATIDGIGGTGFTVGNPQDGTGRFVDRIRSHAAQPFDLVFIEGGQNDHLASPEDLSAAVNETITTVQAQWPDAEIIVMGPAAPQPLGDMLGRIANPIEREARALGALTINPVQAKWLTDENSPTFNLDNAHVNQAGHDFIAGKVTEAVQAWSTPG